MTDYAAPIQWVVLLLSLATSLGIGWAKRGPRRWPKVLGCAALAVAVGFAFTTLAVYANEVCRSTLHACQDHGDGNMSYWFFPLFATPLHWLVMLAFGVRHEPIVVTASAFDLAVEAALGEIQQGRAVHQRCPACASLITVERGDPAQAATTGRIRLRCACSKCDRLFESL